MKNKKMVQNIFLLLTMASGVGMLATEWMHIGIVILVATGVISSILILKEKKGRRSVLSYGPSIAYLYIVGTFFINSLSGFNESLDNFVNWILASVAVGILSVVLTGIQLFRVNR